MQSRLPHTLLAVLILLAAISIFAKPTRAQAPDTPAGADTAGNADPAEKADGTEDGGKSDADSPIREQTIYIPYEKLEGVFDKHGRGVFLPYDKFQQLWKAARATDVKPVEPKPPVGAIISEIENEATVAAEVVKVKALLKIEILAEGWNQVPLRLSDAAITSAVLDGKPARIIGDARAGYKLLVEKKGKQPRRIELELQYSKAITRTPGQNKVSFQAPQAPVSRWRVSVDQAGVKVNIHPMIAATEVPTNGDPANDDAATGTVILAFVGAAPLVSIDWTPKAEGAAGMDALASVHAEQQVRIDEGVTRTRVLLRYTISRAELGKLVIDVPADHKVVNVFDANVRRWPVEKLEGRQRITAELFEPAKGTQQVTVELEKFAGDQPQSKISVPVVGAVGVERQQGEVVVKVAPGLRAEATEATGLLQVGAAELPKSLGQTKWDFSYRYAVVPFQLAFDIEKVRPRILADSLVEAYLEPDKLSLDMAVVYTIQKAGIFRLEIDVPEGYDLRQVTGRKIGAAEPVRVLTRHLEGEKKTRLVVDLAEKAIGKVGLVVELEKELDQPDLLTPTGKTIDIPLGIPTVVADSVERAAGRLLVYAPESLQVNPDKDELKGLRAVSFQAAVRTVPTTRQQKPADVRPVLAFAYTQEPTTLALTTERRKPQVTVRQLLSARIEDGVVKYNATLFYNVLYSGIKSLRVDVPEKLAEHIQNETPEVRRKVIDPAPEDLAEGYVAWSFAGESELLGAGTIELSWEDEKELKELKVGKSVALQVPRLTPRGVDRAWGQIVLAKVETIDVQVSGKPVALRGIDPRHDLMPGTKVSDAALAFEFHDDWELAITATRYKLEDVKRTSIERALVRMVVTRSEQIAVQALYRMRSARQRIEVKLPEDVEFDTKPATINGNVVSLQTEGKKFFVPLVDLNAEKPFLLELRYTFPGDARSLPLPQFPQEPAVQKVYQCVYLPNELVLLGKSGQWTDECRWLPNPSLNWRPVPRDGSDKEEAAKNLVDWVTENVPESGDPLDSFQTDGRLYVFSTRSPAPPPKGTLCLRTADEDRLHGAVFALVMIGGLLLLPVRMGGRALAVGAGIVAVVLIGVFCPIFSLQILNGTLALAIFIVVVIWGVVFLMRMSSAMARGKLGLPAFLDKIEEPPQPERAEPAELVKTDAEPGEKESEEEGGADNV